MLTTIVEFALALVAILVGAAFFTNAVEILGARLGLQQGAVGSLLAAVGTALPESMIAVVAIMEPVVTDGATEEGAEIGVGAILAASATEMPEKSTLSSGYGWQSHTLTLRNMTGVMILQSTIPSRSG